MIRREREIGFELSISATNDGTPEALYVTLLDDRVARTVEVVKDTLLVDYNAKGKVVGIEILGPVKISRITSIIDKPRHESLRRFIEEQAPDELVLA